MATVQQPITEVQPRVAEIPRRNPVVPIKVGVFGGQGSGKTTSAALLALALSKQFHGGAPVFVTDTEPGWQFLRPIFDQERVELIQRTEPTFQAMCRDIRDADKAGACVWVIDSLTIIWQELLSAARGHLLNHHQPGGGPMNDADIGLAPDDELEEGHGAVERDLPQRPGDGALHLRSPAAG